MSRRYAKKDSDEPQEDDGIHAEYFKSVREYSDKYGKNTMTLVQCGTFFEMYAVKNNETGEITETPIMEFSEICGLNIGVKKAAYGKNGTIIIAGFPVFQLDEQLPKLINAGYTVPVIIQDKDGKRNSKGTEKNSRTINRHLLRVFSPGTYISCVTDSSPQLTNNLMCIWMETHKPLLHMNTNTLSKTRDTLVYGVSVVDIFTGKSSIFEYSAPYYLNSTTFDELERYVSVFSPSELLFVSPFDPVDNKKILQYIGVKASKIHIVDSKESADNNVIANCSRQKYINELLSNVYQDDAFSVFQEFRENMVATQSFCYMINFLQEHYATLIRKISIPEFNNTSDRVILGNHTLTQLNVIDDSNIDGKQSGQLSSVLALLNKCCSPMGKRLFKQQLTSPTFDEEWLEKEYIMTETMLTEENYPLIEMSRKQIKQVRDIEKMNRQIILRKIYPSSIAHLYKSISIIQQTNTCFYELPQITDRLCYDEHAAQHLTDANRHIQNSCIRVTDFLDKYLYIDLCKSATSMTSFDHIIIKTGISDKLDELVTKYNSNEHIFNKIRQILNDFMIRSEDGKDTDYVKLHETDKSGSCLQITAKRSETLKKAFVAHNIRGEPIDDKCFISSPELYFYLSDVKFTKVSSASALVNISFPLLDSTCQKLLQLKESINVIIGEVYLKVLQKLEEEYFETLENLASYVAKLDVLQCKTYVAKEYNYCRPTIIGDAAKSFVEAVDLRHCLIEHLQQNELYVTNDVSLGQATDGILLYGTNAVGKTSLIRALGLSIIMAQSGMYVPCSRFNYKPYTAIYSRILANDNLFKGLSTFAVEMSELRVILKMADENSLILGDELCSGTETVSALSIFVAGLMELHDKQTSFIFATHFHEIIHYDEVASMEKLKKQHMEVIYDRANDCLIYDRKLRDGSGPPTYGLEVCKSLYLGDEFLDRAYKIRNKYYPENNGSLQFNTSPYNSNKIKGLCEMCKNQLGEEIHHMRQQKEADDNGFIDTFHKNHKANLLTVCEACHKKVHQDKDTALVRKKTTKGFVIV
jgi:DNA mismatch repair protein MutS